MAENILFKMRIFSIEIILFSSTNNSAFMEILHFVDLVRDIELCFDTEIRYKCHFN